MPRGLSPGRPAGSAARHCPDAQHPAALFRQPGSTGRIGFTVGVLTAIDLNDKLDVFREEIEHVRSERMLTPELHAIQPAVAKRRP
jgi:hypothetical protein